MLAEFNVLALILAGTDVPRVARNEHGERLVAIQLLNDRLKVEVHRVFEGPRLIAVLYAPVVCRLKATGRLWASIRMGMVASSIIFRLHQL